MRVLLDTHAWLWWLLGGGRLAAADRDRLDALAERQALHLSAISLWEAQMIHSRGRLRLPMPFPQWLDHAADPAVVRVVPLDVDVVIALDELPAGFHGDPADRIIAATARCKGLPLVTWDKNLRRSRAAEIWRG